MADGFDTAPADPFAGFNMTPGDRADCALRIGSDVEIAKRVIGDLQRDYGEIVFDDGGFHRYEHTHWWEIDDPALRLAVHAYDGAIYPTGGDRVAVVRLSKTRIDSVINEAAAITARPDFFANAPVGINCASGFILFETNGEPNLFPHDRKHRCRHVLPGCWHTGAVDQPPLGSLLHKLLTGVFQGDNDAADKRELLAEMAGAAATGHAVKLRLPKAVILKGETAENGKSQVLDSIRGVLPANAVSAVTAAQMADERYRVKLRGKLLNAADELSASAIASETFKTIVTGEPISARDLYRSVVDFRSQALNLFATNALPTFSGGIDRGVRRRLIVLPFNRVIPPEERVENIGARIAEEEADLLLAWTVGGAQRLIARRDFLVPASSAEALRQWLYSSDPVLAWTLARVRPLATHLNIDDRTTWYKSGTAHSLFVDWAINNGFRKDTLPAVNGFVQRLEAHVPTVKIRHTNTGNWIRGISINVTGDIEDDDTHPRSPAASPEGEAK